MYQFSIARNLPTNVGHPSFIKSPNPAPVAFAGDPTRSCCTESKFRSWSCRRQGAAVSSPKGKETKQQGEYLHIGAEERHNRHQRSDNYALCYLFWPLVLSPWEWVFLIFWCFVLYYINKNHKLPYLLPIPFNFCAADPPQSCLRQPLKICYNRHCPYLSLFILFLCLQLNSLQKTILSTQF